VATPVALAATRRTEIGKAVAHLRKAGRIPAVVFGHGIESVPVSIDALEFEHVRRTAHSNTILELRIDGKDKRQVLIHGIQVNPRTRHLVHVDLFALKRGEEVTVDVSLHATGSAYAVDRLGGTLLHAVDHVRVRALPEHLPDSLDFSIEPLVDFDHAIHLRDVKLPEHVTLLTDPDEVVAKVAAPHVVEEAAPAAEEAPAEEAPAAEASQS
jgi:large subunit ribosomal protein L25